MEDDPYYSFIVLAGLIFPNKWNLAQNYSFSRQLSDFLAGFQTEGTKTPLKNPASIPRKKFFQKGKE